MGRDVKMPPLMLTPVSAGFPSPGEETVETDLDLNHLIVRHPAATFYMRVSGDSMQGAGINSDDIIVVDRALEPNSGDIVVAHIDGEFTLKRLQRSGKSGYLIAENDAYQPIDVSDREDFQVWGVVTYVISKKR